MKWFAGSNQIIRLGPFHSQLAAWNALRLSDDAQARMKRVHPPGAYVWPEDVKLPKNKSKGKQATKAEKVSPCPICGATEGLLPAEADGGQGPVAMRMCECGFACPEEHWNNLPRRT